jgi:hypothetical protein
MGYRARVDDNQAEIMAGLRNLGISVEPRHDDLLVGFRRRTFWFECKNPTTCFLADGVTFKTGAIKKSQSKLRSTWRGHYSVVTTIEQILNQIGYEQ